MATNRQLELADAIAALRAKLKLIREGILDPVAGSAPPMRSRPIRSGGNWSGNDGQGRRSIPFHIPATRHHRLSTPQGVTSFHFAHKAVSKVTFATSQDGLRVKPGAARAHGRYIERECAVADLGDSPPTPATVSTVHPTELGAASISTEAPVCVGPAERGQPVSHEVYQDRYIARPGAIADQPDGNRALLTNIDPDDDERARFWSQVEEQERNPSPDKMAFRVSDNPEFWTAIAERPDCPEKLRSKIRGADANSEKPFVIPSGKGFRKFLSSQPGWIAPGAKAKKEDENESDSAFAKFIDGRGGRTQYRIDFELPAELTPAESFSLVRDFSQEFEKRKLPYVAVMHAPDHHNHEHNWHCHVIYYDRPTRRITDRDIESLRRAGFETGELTPGMWDFAVVLPKRGRTNGRSTPLKQKKVGEVTRQDWPATLRRRLAAITNAHLERARVPRRVDARTYERLGIAAAPHAHLGTSKNAAETNGEVTATGVENEEKQWRAITAQADARYHAAVQDIEVRCQTFRASRPRSDQRDKDEARLREALQAEADLRCQAFMLGQEVARARSRAELVSKRNGKLLRAFSANPGSVTSPEVTRARHLVDEATRYLKGLERALADELPLIALCEDEADRNASLAKNLESTRREASRELAQKWASKDPQSAVKVIDASNPVRADPPVRTAQNQSRSSDADQQQPSTPLPQQLVQWRASEKSLALHKPSNPSAELSSRQRERDRLAYVLARRIRAGEVDQSLLNSGEVSRMQRQADAHAERLRRQNLQGLGHGL